MEAVERIIANITESVFYVFTIIGRCFMLKKMDEPGWKGIIPFYGQYVLCSHTNAITEWIIEVITSIVSVILLIIGFVIMFTSSYSSSLIIFLIAGVAGLGNLVARILMFNKLSKAFNHGAGFTVGILFLTPIFYMILGVGSSEFVGDVVEERRSYDI